MKLIKQVQLIFRLGSRRKIYEIDLCEVSSGRFVVNFRYGREGAQLRDGSKTLAPVSLSQAERIYERLKDQQIRKGYILREEEGSGVQVPPRPMAGRVASPASSSRATPATPLSDPRALAVLERLRKGERPQQRLQRRDHRQRRLPRPGWSLSRAIWRAGELRIQAAVPLILPLLKGGYGLKDYSAIWALGRCAQLDDLEVLGRLNQLYRARNIPSHLRRMLEEALRALSGEQERERLLTQYLRKLPAPLNELARIGPPQDFQAALSEHLKEPDRHKLQILWTLYLIDNEQTRPALLKLLAVAPLRPPWFKLIRGIYKSAEFRLDAEVLGLLIARFERGLAMYRRGIYSHWVQIDGRSQRLNPENLRSLDAPVAYSHNTRKYFRRRAWRVLERLGDIGSDRYVPIAVASLLQYKDEDARRGSGRERFSHFWTFNHLLYHESSEFKPRRSSLNWKEQPRRQPLPKRRRRRRRQQRELLSTPPRREEAFPWLWGQQLEALIPLIRGSRCEPVQAFALRILEEKPLFCASLGTKDLEAFLQAPYEKTACFGFEWAQRRYDPSRPDLDLVIAVAHSVHGPARTQAQRWIEQSSHHFMERPLFLADLLSGPQKENRVYAQGFLERARLSEESKQILVARIISLLMALAPEEGDRGLIEFLSRQLPRQLIDLGTSVLRDLLGDPRESLQKLGAEILMARNREGHSPKEEELVALLDAQHHSVQAQGLRLIKQLSPGQLFSYQSLIIALCLHSKAEFRQEIRPNLQRMLWQNRERAEDLAIELMSALLRHRLADGVGTDLVKMLAEDLGPALEGLPKELIWRLIDSKRSFAQELGGLLLGRLLRAEDLEMAEIARLGNHEIYRIREAAWNMYRQAPQRVRADLTEALPILDSDWEDSRRFAIDYFGSEHFSAEDFPTSTLVALCDSVKPEIEHFGRQLITRYFRDEEGPEFMLKLSEHPSATLQLFVSNYLEGYAAGHPERLEQLRPYLSAVLSRINQGGLAKRRLFRFLKAEARESESSARIIGELMGRHSASIAVGDRAAALEIMLQIHGDWPELPLPIKVSEMEVRGGVSL